MKIEEIDDDMKKFLKVFYNQQDNCPYHWIVDNRAYCSKKDRFIRSNNVCMGCPELPAPEATKEMTLDEYNSRILSDEQFDALLKRVKKAKKEGS